MDDFPAKTRSMRLVEEFTDKEGEQTVVYAIAREEWQTL